jgi:hypothetical protein
VVKQAGAAKEDAIVMNAPRHLILVVLLGIVFGGAGAARAQQSQGAPPPKPPAQVHPDTARPPTAAEVQSIVDGWVVVQAQTALGLSDDQFPQFVIRLRGLQETRRRNQRAHNQLIQQLWRLANPKNPAADEAQLREKLKALDDLDAKSAADLSKAYDAIDQVLDVRQQARFRVFLDQVERRMLEILTKARAQSEARGGRLGRGRGGLQ